VSVVLPSRDRQSRRRMRLPGFLVCNVVFRPFVAAYTGKAAAVIIMLDAINARIQPTMTPNTAMMIRRKNEKTNR